MKSQTHWDRAIAVSAFAALVICVLLLLSPAMCGCAAFTGDFMLDHPVQGVQTRHTHFGSLIPFQTVGGFAMVIGRGTFYVANGAGVLIHVDVACGWGGEVDYPIQPGHEQGFAEWGSECRLVGSSP